MITVRTQKSVKNAKAYFREHLVQGDYYSEGHQVEGHWVGRGAERLGLKINSPIRAKEYDRLCDNLHPMTGQKLTVRTRKARRIYDDFAVAPPKSVSIMAVTMGDERIVAAHDRAVAVAIVELEKAAGTRVRKGGKDQTRRTGEIVAAVFRHDASRDLDPLLHTHLLVFNATWDPVERRWKALEAGDMFEKTKFLTEVYRNHLAGELTAMGYRLRESQHGYEIAGVPEAVITRLSKRSQAIALEEERLTAKLGQPLTNNGRAAVAHSTRRRKIKDLPASELVRRQREQLTPEELSLLEGLRTGKVVPLIPTPAPAETIQETRAASAVERADEPKVKTLQQPAGQPREQHAAGTSFLRSASREPKASRLAQEAVAFARDHVFERASVVREHELLTVALGYSRGQLTLEEVRSAVGPETDLIRLDEMLTTGQTLQEEKRMIALVNAGVGQYPPLNPAFRAAATLSEEQRRVAETILHSPDAVIGLRGGAGAGKTFVLEQVVAALEANGRQILLFAPTAGAVDVLRKEGFPQSQTVQHLLMNPALQADLRGKVLVVDEAGLLSTRQMVRLLELRRSAEARLILCGDTREHAGVEAGDALRLLEGHSALQVSELGEIRRQTEEEYRKAIAEIAAGHPGRAFVRLDRMGAVEAIETEERYSRLAADYVTAVEAGDSALIVAPTWSEIERVNAEVRERLKETGHLDRHEATVETHRSLQWTEAQRRDFRNYEPGHVLTFHRATKDFAAGEWGEVVKATPERLTVRKLNREQVTISRKQVQCFDVAVVKPLPIARGEQLLIQGNQRKDGLLNGQVVTVDAVKADGSVSLTNGRSIPRDFRRFTHGYCVTSQSSQGKTVDRVFVAVDSHSGRAVNRKQFYVSASRGRKSIKIYTDDKDELREAVTRPGTREGAVELVERVTQQLRKAAVGAPRESANRGVRI